MGWIKLNDTNITLELIFLNSHVQKKPLSISIAKKKMTG